MQTIYPVITLYQPWATWIMRGWKTIETRTHSRFSCLNGQDILIHSGQHVDASATNTPYLGPWLLRHKPEEIISGYILGFAHVSNFRQLNPSDAYEALIECETLRYGLFLDNINPLKTPIPAKGSMGIWYFDIHSQTKCTNVKTHS